MSFWNLEVPSERLSIVDHKTGSRLTYGELNQKIADVTPLINAPHKQLGFLLCENSVDCVATYLGALRVGAAIALLDSNIAPDQLDYLIRMYEPDWVAAPRALDLPERIQATTTWGQLGMWSSPKREERSIFSELAVLLSTSGSTGSPKLVRLSYRNLQANAAAIAQYLEQDSGDRPITSLGMQYSYGLSVINSHLHVGATLLLTDSSVMQRDFWEFFSHERASSLAAVPYMYQMMLRVKLLTRKTIPSLRVLTQAGGALAPNFAQQIHSTAQSQGWRFYVMYGQTEATARIAYVPPDLLPFKWGAIGIPIPGGALQVNSENQELIYEGPNVMLGYAESASDLAKGDDCNGRLHTGDLGRQDEDGFFYVTGRLKRFLKIFGHRFSLDELETALQREFNTPVACFGSDDRLHVAVEAESEIPRLTSFICRSYRLHHSAVSVIHLSSLPQNANGKVDYSSLKSLVFG